MRAFLEGTAAAPECPHCWHEVKRRDDANRTVASDQCCFCGRWRARLVPVVLRDGHGPHLKRLVPPDPEEVL